MTHYYQSLFLEKMKAILKKGYLLIASAILGFAFFASITLLTVKPEYDAVTQIVVRQTNKQQEGNDKSTNDTLKTYENLIDTPLVLEEITAKDGGQLTVDALVNKIRVTADSDSRVFRIIVRDKSPVRATMLVNAIAHVFQQKAPEVLGVDQVTILTPAEHPTKPSYPHPWWMGAIGSGVGFLLTLFVLWYRVSRDKTVQNERIVESLGWDLIGVVPQMKNDEIADARYKRTIMTSDNKETKRRI